MPTSHMSHAHTKAVEHISPPRLCFYVLLGLCTYLTLVFSLRFRRCRKLHRAYPYHTRETMTKMTDHDAWAIQKQIMQGEFPFMMLKALQFALFRVSNIAPFPLGKKKKKRRYLQSLTIMADVRYSYDISPPPQNVAVLRLHHLIQAICRHGHFDWRIYRIRTTIRPGPDGHCSNQVSAQGLPG